MQLFTDRRYRDLILLVLGLAGLTWFLLDLDEHHPFGSLEFPYEEEELIAKVDSSLKAWNINYAYDNYQMSLSRYQGLLDLLDRKKQGERLGDLPVYYWSIQEQIIDAAKEETYYNSISVDLNGRIIGVDTPDSKLLSEEALNEKAINYALQEAMIELSQSQKDTLVTALTDFQQLDRANLGAAGRYFREEGEGFRPGSGYFSRIINGLAENYSRFYLKQSGWVEYDFQVDTVIFIENADMRFAKVKMKAGKELLGLNPEINIEVLPAGTIKSMTVEIPESNASSFNDTFNDIRILIALVFGAWLLIIFYLRIKARAVDTQLALIIAVLIGFLFPGVVLLGLLNSLGLASTFQAGKIIGFVMLMGVSGAAGAIGFFVLTAVSDSVTRQYWSEKLKTWDLIRQGWFRNKPTGWALLGAIAVGSLMAGSWQLLLDIFPVTGVGYHGTLLNDMFILPGVASVLISLLVSLGFVLSLFLILSNQLFGLTGKKWLIPVIGAIGFGLFNINPIDIQPIQYEILINVILGFMLGYFYVQFDYLTVAGGYFIFYGLMLSSGGWLIENSPDSNVFIIYILLVISMLLFGLYFTLKGTDRDELPDYVPSYIEDQAKEQRVKQELAIARIVQETFLPSKVERLKGLDIAGVCKPAQDTGGDYYDLISLGNNRTALAIGDVSGKGIKAAFYMTFTKGVLHSLSALILSPLELLNQLNRLFNENATRGTFISMIYGVLEADKRLFTFARAGHNPILVVHEDGSSEWLNSKGLGIGVSKGDQFLRHTEEVEYKIREGDVVVLYTDGVTEMMDPGGRFYGEERLKQLVNAIKENSAADILEKITSDVREFKGTAKQHDDMTLLIIKADARIEAPY